MQTVVPAEDLSRVGTVHGYGLGLERYAMDSMTVICPIGTGEVQPVSFGDDADAGTAVSVMTYTATAGPQAIMGVEALTAVKGSITDSRARRPDGAGAVTRRPSIDQTVMR